MIDSITLRNFQKHKKLTLKLNPSVTTLVGDTDAGKSAVLRALKWACTNRPRGTQFVRHGRKKAGVALHVDGHRVVREAGDKTNLYKLDDKVYKAFKLSVPAPIADLLNVGDINFQNQIDPPFWFTLSAPQVSKELNQIVNLGEIDCALANAAKDRRLAKAKVEVSRDRLRDAKKKVKDLAWAGELAKDVDRLERLQSEMAESSERADALSRGLESLRASSASLRRLGAALSDAVALKRSWRNYGHVSERAEELKAVLGDMRALRARGDPAEDFKPLEALNGRLAASSDKVRALSAAHFALANLEFEVEDADERLEPMIKKLRKHLKGRCPICRKPLRQSQSSYPTSILATRPRPHAARTKTAGMKRKGVTPSS